MYIPLPMEMDAAMEASPRRSSAASSSPEFEFWGAGDPPTQLHTADELFADGVLLPLHLLSLRPPPYPDAEAPTGAHAEPEPDPPSPPPPPPAAPLAADLTASISCSPTSGSKRWKDIFRVGEKKPAEEKEKRKDRKGTAAGGAAELNINIWPFSRSRSAGSAAAGGSSGGRPRASISGRRVSSAPCSRSNSRGESSKHHHAASGGRRWAASPGRPVAGVPVGRASPVWQIRRPEHRDSDKGAGGGGRKAKGAAGVRVLNMNVNTCIGYRGQRSCRGDDKGGVTGRAPNLNEGNNSTSLFSLRSLFSKKVY